MNQSKLFFDDEFEALQLMVSNSGKTIKDIAQFLWPDMKPESAYTKLKACLSPTGDERLRFGQVLALMKFCERYEPLMYLCDETLHARPDRKAVKDEEVKLVEVINMAANTMQSVMARLERLRAEK